VTTAAAVPLSRPRGKFEAGLLACYTDILLMRLSFRAHHRQARHPILGGASNRTTTLAHQHSRGHEDGLIQRHHVLRCNLLVQAERPRTHPGPAQEREPHAAKDVSTAFPADRSHPGLPIKGTVVATAALHKLPDLQPKSNTRVEDGGLTAVADSGFAHLDVLPRPFQNDPPSQQTDLGRQLAVMFRTSPPIPSPTCCRRVQHNLTRTARGR